MCHKGRRGVYLRGSAPFSYALQLAGGFDGFGGLNGRLWRGCGGENATGVHGSGFGSWMDGRVDSWVDGWVDSWTDIFMLVIGHKKRFL